MFPKLKCLLKPAAVAVLAFAFTHAYATPTYCSDPLGNADGLKLYDVSFKAGTQNSRNASDCYGVVIKENATNKTTIQQWADEGYSWSHLLGTDGSLSSTYQTLKFTLSGTGFDNDQTSGFWNLKWEDQDPTTPLDLPVALDFIVALKASDRYALYYFDDLYLQRDPNNQGSGSWDIAFVNHGGNEPGLSHLELFVGQNSIPEPSTLLLLGSGLVGLAARRRRVHGG